MNMVAITWDKNDFCHGQLSDGYSTIKVLIDPPGGRNNVSVVSSNPKPKDVFLIKHAY